MSAFFLGHKRAIHSLMVECYVACANELHSPFLRDLKNLSSSPLSDSEVDSVPCPCFIHVGRSAAPSTTHHNGLLAQIHPANGQLHRAMRSRHLRASIIEVIELVTRGVVHPHDSTHLLCQLEFPGDIRCSVLRTSEHQIPKVI